MDHEHIGGDRVGRPTAEIRRSAGYSSVTVRVLIDGWPMEWQCGTGAQIPFLGRETVKIAR